MALPEYHVTADLVADNVTDALDIRMLRNVLLGSKKSVNIYFDSNGGTSDETFRTVTIGQTVGELPVPTRTGFNFDGWYNDYGEKVDENTLITQISDLYVCAKWTAKAYDLSFSNGTGYTITVNRTSSPYANASVGAISSGTAIYYGDILSVSYTASTGYTLKSNGITSATVTQDITSSSIYATASANSYTYNIVYESSNGTVLDTASATYKYGTTNTITPKSFAGYTTPSSQSVKWNSTSAKTITFTYTPKSVSTSQNMASGVWGIEGSTEFLTYSVKAEYRNRTADSIQVRVVWTNTLIAYYYYQRGQVFNANISGKSTGNVTIVSYNTWVDSTNYERSLSGTSDWITIPLSATQTTISISADAYKQLSGGELVNINESWSATFNIPTY